MVEYYPPRYPTWILLVLLTEGSFAPDQDVLKRLQFWAVDVLIILYYLGPAN